VKSKTLKVGMTLGLGGERFMNKKITLVMSAIVSAVLLVALSGCGNSSLFAFSDPEPGQFTIAVPSDATNEARALLLLEAQGIITLASGVGLTATVDDIVRNRYGIEIVEVDAAMLPSPLKNVDFAIINGNYALHAGIDTSTALAIEDPFSIAAIEYANVVAVRANDINTEKTRVLVEVLQGLEVQQFITDTYAGIVTPVNTPANVSSGQVSSNDKIIRVGASPSPHAEILEFARPLIEAKGFTLEIIEYSDYMQPNQALVSGELDANYFQHVHYLGAYNQENNTSLVTAGKIHFEPLSIYPGRLASLDDLKN